MDSNGEQLVANGTMCLKLFDTEMEKEIAVGVNWPYDTLNKDECIISKTLSSDFGIQVGDIVQLRILWTA